MKTKVQKRNNDSYKTEKKEMWEDKKENSPKC